MGSTVGATVTRTSISSDEKNLDVATPQAAPFDPPTEGGLTRSAVHGPARPPRPDLLPEAAQTAMATACAFDASTLAKSSPSPQPR
jgi:hypothetical protein